MTDVQQLEEQLLQQAKEQDVDLVGPDGLLSGLMKRVLETALEAGWIQPRLQEPLAGLFSGRAVCIASQNPDGDIDAHAPAFRPRKSGSA